MTQYKMDGVHELPLPLYAKIIMRLLTADGAQIALGASVCSELDDVANDGSLLPDREFGGVFESFRPYQLPNAAIDPTTPDWRRALHVPVPAKDGRSLTASLCPPGRTQLPYDVDILGGYTLALTARERPGDEDPIFVLFGSDVKELFTTLHGRRCAYELEKRDRAPIDARAHAAQELAALLDL